jgi:anhydro-N-acetylmuramic acid kinase
MKTVIGLMSGTSMDGVDASLIETDGESLIKIKGSLNVPYEESFKLELIENISKKKISSQTELKLTQFHADAVSKLIEKENLIKSQIDLIGFHGQTIHHDPDNQITIQMGDGDLLAKLCDIDVVNDFRSNDVLNGGQGAPLVPLFHQAIIGDLPKPFMILNVGGVANVSWVDEMDEVSAFDSGPGNALIDDFMYQRTGSRMDQNGNLGLSGKVNSKVLNTLMENPFFEMKGPKSLDRNHFDSSPVFELSDADAAATLCAFTAEAVRKSISHFQNSPSLCAVSGGGRKNKAIIRELEKRLETKVSTTEEFGWEGDYLESQAFAYLAVRSVKGLPLSLPSTTGVSKPVSGGTLHPKGV